MNWTPICFKDIYNRPLYEHICNQYRMLIIESRTFASPPRTFSLCTLLPLVFYRTFPPSLAVFLTCYRSEICLCLELEGPCTRLHLDFVYDVYPIATPLLRADIFFKLQFVNFILNEYQSINQN